MNRFNLKENRIEEILSKNDVKIGDLYYFDRVTSTMDVALDSDFTSLKDKTIIIADEQTKGRGRYNRKWYGSARDCMFSLVLKDFDFNIPYSMIASLAVYKVLKPLSKRIGLKWINDVYWDLKKLAGILTEEVKGITVIGVGVNINSKSFPYEIKNSATSLYLETGKTFDRLEYFGEFIVSIINAIDEAHNGKVEDLLKQWEKASRMKGAVIHVKTGTREYSGIVYGINYKTGALKLKVKNEIVELYDGTVSYL